MAPKRTTRSTADQETINTTSVTNAQLQAMIDQGVTAALEARDALRSTNGDDSHNSGTGVRKTERATRECTYTDFLNNCAVKNQVKFATCTLHSVALTWWNIHVKAVGHDAAYGYFKRECPKLKNNNNHGNQGGRNNAPAMVYAVGREGTDPDANVVTEDLPGLPPTRQVVFQIDLIPDAAPVARAPYRLAPPEMKELSEQLKELSDKGFIRPSFLTLGSSGKINAECYRARYRKKGDDMQHFEDWIRGNLSERYLMPVKLGSFDAIIGMDWLRRHHAMIVCNKKLVRIPFGSETLVFRGAKSYIERESRLTVTPCSKVREYRAKGCHVFLAQISAAHEDDKPKRKQVKDVPIVQDFPKVFPENLPGLPPARPVEFQIDLIPEVAPMARAPYRLAPSEIKELSEQLQ
nr:reverse transcriptase domain-containing protein [Tanacetum cinerariifolium]